MSDLSEVVITAPDPDWLLDLARQLVGERLAASIHSFEPVRSIYRWRGEVVERVEGRISLQTRSDLIPEIVERVKSVHPYEVPGISARPIEGGNPDYLQWMHDESGGGHVAKASGQQQERDVEQPERDRAAKWLTGYLLSQPGGEAASADVREAAEAEGINQRTLYRAASRAKVTISRKGFPSRTTWRIEPDAGNPA